MQLYHQLGAPTMENTKIIIRQNLIKSCPMTIEDVNLDNRMFGSDISTFRVQSTSPKPVQVIDDSIEIPK